MGTNCIELELQLFPDALWRCCCYWFHLYKLTHYSILELKAPLLPSPHQTIRKIQCQCWIWQQRQRGGSLQLIPSPISPSVVFDLLRAFLYHLETCRDQEKRDFLWIYLLILFAIAILSHVFWPFQSFLFLTIRASLLMFLCLALIHQVCAHICLHIHVF